ncbi:hypothetical protein BAE44_0021916 [Dichanthelium oligosanthes]|uniref:Uncharacterized protein n=1 Tax=Dichanthelium oligosanthes TaxID=888268 RepID=A0A1E5UWB5_9POAL|nr:hypothetical protein BAE44_0021916 [Dichanthelium oligosanthes]
MSRLLNLMRFPSSAKVLGDCSTSSHLRYCRDIRFPIPSGNFTPQPTIRQSSFLSRQILAGSSFRDAPRKSNVCRSCRFPISSRSSVSRLPFSLRYLK